MSTYYSIDAIRALHTDAGGHWFDPGWAQFFSSRNCSPTHTSPSGLVYFVTSEKRPDALRLFSVRLFDPSHPLRITTVGGFQAYANKEAAHRAASEFPEG